MSLFEFFPLGLAATAIVLRYKLADRTVPLVAWAAQPDARGHNSSNARNLPARRRHYDGAQLPCHPRSPGPSASSISSIQWRTGVVVPD